MSLILFTIIIVTIIIHIFISIRYVASPENLIQLIILGITTALVLRGDQEEGEELWQERRHLAALVLTLSCMTMMMMNLMIF